MSVLRRTAAGAVAALAVVIAGPAFTATAASNPHHYHFKSIVSISGAKLEACRLRTASPAPWKVKVRVNAKRSTGKVMAGAQGMRNGTPVRKGWASGTVRKGHVSTIGTVKVPRGSAYTLSAGIGTGGMGNGGEFKVANLRRC